MSATRLLFASCHGYVDPSSGAALATRDVLELLATRGFDCRVLSTGVLDYEQETSLESVLESLEVPFSRAQAVLPLQNLHRMANTTDPRDFYKVTRILLVPSLWRETFGRVAAEGLANGLPVLASDRGALPETLGDAGFLFTIPDRCTPTSGAVPTAREVEPWLATIERLWDDPDWEAKHRSLARNEAGRWAAEQVGALYEPVFSEAAVAG